MDSWRIIDLDKFRSKFTELHSSTGKVPGSVMSNPDGTMFHVFDIDQFRDCQIAEHGF